MLRGFAGLGLEVELTCKANLLGVVDGHVHELCEVTHFSFHVRIPQALIAFAATPEHIALAAQAVRHIQRFLHLRCGEGKHIGLRARRRTVHVARMAKQVGCPPEELDAACILMPLERLGHCVEMRV